MTESTADDDPFIRLSAVTVRYGDRVVLDRVDMSIETRGGLIAVTGPSGSGKSTLLHLLSGINAPDGGVVTSTRPNLSVAWVFQTPELLVARSALDNAVLGSHLSGVDAKLGADRSRASLSICGLGDHLDTRAGNLSGGEQQRVAIARAMSSDCDIVLADEPTASLDGKNRDAIGQALVDVARCRPVVVATHDLELASLADEIYELRSGRLQRTETRPVTGRTLPDESVVATAARSPGLRAGVVETIRNCRSRPVRTVLRSALAIAVAFIGTMTMASVRADLTSDWSQLRSQGRDLVTVAAADGAIDANDCEHTPSRLSSIQAAGSEMDSSEVRLRLAPDRRVTAYTITPGLLSVAFPEADRLSARPAVYLGARLADELGSSRAGVAETVDGTVIQIGGVLPVSARVEKFNDGLVVVARPSALAAFCFIEPQGTAESILDVVPGLFPPSVAPQSAPFRPDLDWGDRSPERQLGRLTPLPILVGSTCVGLLGVLLWFERRRDLALYRLLGARRSWLAGLMLSDTLLVGMVPWSVGVSIALSLKGDALRQDVVAQGAWRDDLAGLSVLLIASLVTWTFSAHRNPLKVVRRST